MRTTLNFDDDAAEKLRDLAHRRRVPFKVVVNSVLRHDLAAQENRVDVFRSPFRPGVDPLRLSQLSDDLEVRRFRQVEPRS